MIAPGTGLGVPVVTTPVILLTLPNGEPSNFALTDERHIHLLQYVLKGKINASGLPALLGRQTFPLSTTGARSRTR